MCTFFSSLNLSDFFVIHVLTHGHYEPKQNVLCRTLQLMLSYWYFLCNARIIHSFSWFTGTNPWNLCAACLECQTPFQTLLVIAGSECVLVQKQTIAMHVKF